MNEFDLIAAYFAPLAGSGALNLQDDAALLNAPDGEQLIITTDTLNEGVHFKVGTSPEKIAQKALRVNLSDLAAMGAQPLGYTLNLSLPVMPSHDGIRPAERSLSEAQTPSFDGVTSREGFLTHFCRGLAADHAAFKLTLLGGDTTRTHGPLSITITAYGSTPRPLLRSGAQADDGIYVTGKIGAGYLGLHDHSSETIAHYECPTPRLKEGLTLRGLATACMDISDGLVQDLGHLCKASGVGARIQLADIPLADFDYDRLAQITGGDDYELLFTAPDGASLPPCARIGTITQTPEIHWLDDAGKEEHIARGGWQHF